MGPSLASFTATTAVCAVLAGTGIAVGAAPAGPYFAEDGKLFVRPAFTIDVSGTGSWLISHSHWLTWHSTVATAVTTFYTNTCRPSCAAGHFTREPARVRFYDVRPCHGKPVFVRFAIVDPAGRRLLSGDFRGLGYLPGC